MRAGITHEGSFQALTGGDEQLRKELSVELRAGEGFPPTYVWANADDGLVSPRNTLLLGEALAQAGVPHERRLFPQGNHGCSLAYGTSAWTWSDEAIGFLDRWLR